MNIVNWSWPMESNYSALAWIEQSFVVHINTHENLDEHWTQINQSIKRSHLYDIIKSEMAYELLAKSWEKWLFHLTEYFDVFLSTVKVWMELFASFTTVIYINTDGIRTNKRCSLTSSYIWIKCHSLFSFQNDKSQKFIASFRSYMTRNHISVFGWLRFSSGMHSQFYN